MAGGSLRHAVYKRVHLERNSDPSKTKHHPQEKRDDFLRRVRLVKKRREKLQALQQKADNANPQEFQFAMHSHKLIDGKLVKTKGKIIDELTDNVIKYNKKQRSQLRKKPKKR